MTAVEIIAESRRGAAPDIVQKKSDLVKIASLMLVYLGRIAEIPPGAEPHGRLALAIIGRTITDLAERAHLNSKLRPETRYRGGSRRLDALKGLARGGIEKWCFHLSIDFQHLLDELLDCGILTDADEAVLNKFRREAGVREPLQLGKNTKQGNGNG